MGPQISTARSNERPNDRTTDRPTDRPTDRTPERPNDRTPFVTISPTDSSQLALKAPQLLSEWQTSHRLSPAPSHLGPFAARLEGSHGRQAIARPVAPHGSRAPSKELEVSALREANICCNMAKCQLNRHLLSKSLFADHPHRSSARLALFTRPHVSQTTKSHYMPSYDSTWWFNTVAQFRRLYIP